MVGKPQGIWLRTLVPNGPVVQFKSFWVLHGDNQLIKYVNPVAGAANGRRSAGVAAYLTTACASWSGGRWLLPSQNGWR